MALNPWRVGLQHHVGGLVLFFFIDPSPTDIYTLSLHDALPIWIVLVFMEKDHSKDTKPDFNAAFGKFGSALIISLHEDGDIYGCEVVHSAHQKQGFSSIGSIEDRKSTRLNSSHVSISYAVFCLK